MRLLTQIIAIAILTTLAGSPAAGQDEAPDYSREGADSCLACHENEAVLALFRGVHANPSDPRGPFGHGQLQCEACHGASGSHAGRVRRGDLLGSLNESAVVIQPDGATQSQTGSALNAVRREAAFGDTAHYAVSDKTPVAAEIRPKIIVHAVIDK